MQSDIPLQNVSVSIVLSESTASMLKLNVPNLESYIGDSEASICAIKALTQTDVEQIESSNKNIQESFFLQGPDKEALDSNVITKETVYVSRRINESTSSFDIIDDLSENVLKSTNSKGKIEHDEPVLDIVQMYTRPLVSIKTEAHKGYLEARNNNLFITAVNSELSVTNSGWINVCRICHGGESLGSLLSPCRCRGSIALAHLACLERWLKESASSRCELCQHHFDIIREPKYSIPASIFVFLRHPGDHYKDLLLDLLAFVIYTPSAFASTYILMLLCESIAKANFQYNRSFSAHVMAFSAVFGIAAIDFTYSSWLIVTLQRHIDAWRTWYKNTCQLKLILPTWKTHRHRRHRKNMQLPD